MSGPLRIAAAVLLSFSLGLHWTLLQSVAWTTMFLDRLPTAGVTEALRTTFDGRHPCRICLAVREGRTADRRETRAPNPTNGQVTKLDLAQAASPPRLVLHRPPVVPTFVGDVPFASRTEQPPTPPPRVS